MILDVQSGLRLLEDNQSVLWLVAVAFFGVGDLVTTGIGLQSGRIVEAGPLAAGLVRQFGYPGMVLLKGAVVGLSYGVWCLLSDPDRLGIPLALAVMGCLVTAWNLRILAVVHG